MGAGRKVKAGAAGNQKGKPPCRVYGSPLFSRAALGSARGCKGRSPLHEITLGSPFPGGEERSASAGGGMGAKKQTKVRGGERQERQAPPVDSGMARSAGNQPGKPPAWCSNGRSSRQRRGTSPHHSNNFLRKM